MTLMQLLCRGSACAAVGVVLLLAVAPQLSAQVDLEIGTGVTVEAYDPAQHWFAGPETDFLLFVGPGGNFVSLALSDGQAAPGVRLLVFGDLFVAAPNDEFTWANIHAGKFEPFATWLYGDHPINASPFGDYYLGYVDDRREYGGGYAVDDGPIWGWMHVIVSEPFNAVVVVDSVLAHGPGAEGIVIGTTQVIPEPTSLLLLGTSAPLLMRRRCSADRVQTR